MLDEELTKNMLSCKHIVIMFPIPNEHAPSPPSPARPPDLGLTQSHISSLTLSEHVQERFPTLLYVFVRQYDRSGDYSKVAVYLSRLGGKERTVLGRCDAHVEPKGGFHEKEG